MLRFSFHNKSLFRFSFCSQFDALDDQPIKKKIVLHTSALGFERNGESKYKIMINIDTQASYLVYDKGNHLLTAQ